MRAVLAGLTCPLASKRWFMWTVTLGAEDAAATRVREPVDICAGTEAGKGPTGRGRSPLPPLCRGLAPAGRSSTEAGEGSRREERCDESGDGAVQRGGGDEVVVGTIQRTTYARNERLRVRGVEGWSGTSTSSRTAPLPVSFAALSTCLPAAAVVSTLHPPLRAASASFKLHLRFLSAS